MSKVFVCNQMARNLIVSIPLDERKKQSGNDDGLTVNPDGTVVIKPGIGNQVEFDSRVFEKIAKGNKAIQAYIDTKRISVSNKRITEEKALSQKSGDAERPEHLKDTREKEQKEGKVKHESKSIETLETKGSDDAPAGGQK